MFIQSDTLILTNLILYTVSVNRFLRMHTMCNRLAKVQFIVRISSDDHNQCYISPMLLCNSVYVFE